MPKNKTLPSRKELEKELNKVQKWADEKIRNQEEKQREIFEKKELKKKNTKKIILINAHDGSKLGDSTINILDPTSILTSLIIRKLKVYNIASIVINDISQNFYPELYHHRHHHLSLCSRSLKQTFNLCEDTDNILVHIIYGSYLNYIEFIISDCVMDNYLYDGDDEFDYNGMLNMIRNKAMKRIKNIPKNYLSSNLDEFNQIITNYNGSLQYMWVINYLQSYFE